ncbi:MAG: hypothetical protein AAGK32_05190, partial [Actinomycetota bacterium]
RLNRELGTTVFLTSHDVADIEHVADRAVVVNRGGIIYDADVEDMRRTLLATKRIDVQLGAGLNGEGPPVPAGDAFGPGTTIDGGQPPGRLVIDVDTGVRPVHEVLHRVLQSELPVTDVSVTDPPLERVIGTIYTDGSTA